MTLEELARIANELGKRRLATELRVHDKGQVVALKEHLETTPGPAGWCDFLLGVSIYLDEEIPLGIIRCYFNDGTTQDLRLT